MKAALNLLSRRGFLQASSLAGGGLLLGLSCGPAGSGTAYTFSPSILIRITPDGVITLLAKNPDMGQGVKTSLPMLLAEELDVGLDQVKIEQAPWDARLSDQGAGGSNSILSAWEPLRRAGATARAMLLSAAAQRLKVPADQLSTARARVFHAASGRSLGYGELADAAARLPVPDAAQIKLKPRSAYTLLGTRVPGVDSAAMVRGAPLFCLDHDRPGQLHAVYEQCPQFGGAVVSANLAHIKSLPGVRDAFVLPGSADAMRRHPSVYGLSGYCPGVAIVASSTWAALKAKSVLQVVWQTLPDSQHNSRSEREQALALLIRDGAEVWRDDGDTRAALASATTVVEAIYEAPTLAHAALEPMSCLAEPMPDGGLHLITPSQQPANVPLMIEAVLGLPSQRVRVSIPRLGGAFGRRAESDFVLIAAAMALRMKLPIKLIYTREDDMRHDFYRPPVWQKFRAGLDAQGSIVAWHLHTVRHAFRDPTTPKLRATLFPARFIPNYRVEATMLSSPVPSGAYRAPGNNTNAFMLEGFLDELAHAARQDPLAFRLQMLGQDRELKEPDFDMARMKAVLHLAADRAGWGRILPRGTGLGLASQFSYGGYVAYVVEVSVTPAGRLRVQRVTAAVDVGQIVNLDGAEQQVQGSVMDALSSSLFQAITLDDGAVVQGNFDSYALLRMPDAPGRIDVHFVDSERAPTGLGEPGIPPLAPALCNAVFAATGKRIRSLPLSQHDLSWT